MYNCGPHARLPLTGILPPKRPCLIEPPTCRGNPPKEIPLIQVAYPNENKSHLQVQPVQGEPGVDPCCAPSPCPGFDENPSICDPVACTAGAHDTTAPGACYDRQPLHQRQCECEKCLKVRWDAAETGQTCYQHVDGNQWQDLTKRHRDPEIQAIRDKMRNSLRMRDHLTWCPTDESLSCVVRRFRGYPLGITGQASVHYGAAQDLDYPKTITHGILSPEVTPGTKLISPPAMKWVDQVDLDIKESIYESSKVRPVGKSHDQAERLPPHVDPDTTGFGKPTDKSISAGLLINPPKSKDEVAAESRCCRALYKVTHGEYDPGEQICRNYGGSFRRTGTFGMPTPNDVAGRWAKNVVHNWRACDPDPPFVSKVYADHIDVRYPKLGMGTEVNCIRTKLGDGFAYGKKPNVNKDRPIGEIIFNRCPNPGASKATKIMQNLKNWLGRVRKSLRTIFGPNLETFYEALIAQDETCGGLLDYDTVIKAMVAERIPCSLQEREFMEALALVNVFQPAPCDKINYHALMDLLKGYADPQFHCKTTTLKPYYCPHTNNEGQGCLDHFTTMYQDMTRNMCEDQDCVTKAKEMRLNGMPSVRSDKRPTKIRSTKDKTNYGDDGDAYSLIWPSFYTSNGITCRDAFRPMTKDEIAGVLCMAQVDMTHEELNRAWAAAEALDPEEKCRVSYQTFREALCQVREEAARIHNVHINYPTEPCGDPPPCPKGKPNPCCGVDP